MASDMRAFWPTAGLSEPPMPRLVPSFIWRDSSASRTASWMNVVQADISEGPFSFRLELGTDTATSLPAATREDLDLDTAGSA